MSVPGLSAQDKKQIDQIFKEGKKNIQIVDLQKQWHSRKMHENIKIVEGIVNEISKQSYQTWLEKQKPQNRNISSLFKIQVIQDIQQEYQKNISSIDTVIDQANKKLGKLQKKAIEPNALEKVLKQPQQGHIYLRYAEQLKKQSENKQIPKQSEHTFNKQAKVQQQVQHKKQTQNHQKQTVNIQNHNQEKKEEHKVEQKTIQKTQTKIQHKQQDNKEHKQLDNKVQKRQKNQQNKQVEKQRKDLNSHQQKVEVLHENQNTTKTETHKAENKIQQNHQKQTKQQKLKQQHTNQKVIHQGKQLQKSEQPNMNQNQVKQPIHQNKNDIAQKQNIDVTKTQNKPEKIQQNEQKQQKKQPKSRKASESKKQSDNITNKTQKQKQAIKEVATKKQRKQSETKVQKKQKIEQPASKIQKKHEQTKNVIQQNKKKPENRLTTLLSKYFKAPIQKTQKIHENTSTFQLNLNHSPNATIENQINFEIKILTGQKQITKLQAELQAKNVINDVAENQYVIFEIHTKRSQELQQKIQHYIKQVKLKFDGLQFKTFTQTDRLYLTLFFHNQNANSVLNKIHNIFTDKNVQDHAKVQIKMKFGLGNEGKQKPEERKFIKCITKGFDLHFAVEGSSAINYRFRKNVELQNKQSALYSLLALTRNSTLKFKWKKIDDVNNFFSKLGILEAVQQTPSIKQIVLDGFHEFFEIGAPQSLKIQNILSIVLSQIQSNKIQITRLNKNSLISFSIVHGRSVGALVTKKQ